MRREDQQETGIVLGWQGGGHLGDFCLFPIVCVSRCRKGVLLTPRRSTAGAFLRMDSGGGGEGKGRGGGGGGEVRCTPLSSPLTDPTDH